MLKADEDGRMLFLRKEFLLYIIKCEWNGGTGHLLKIISRSTCGNLTLNIMLIRKKYRMANILHCRAIFSQIWKQ